jgi:uncharacterized membrane protein
MMGQGFLGMGAGMWLLWILLAVLVLWLGARMFQRPSSPESARDDDPALTLKKRLAHGEIDEETYQHLLRKLE